MDDDYPLPCASPDRDGWEYTHAWVAGMMAVEPEDVATVAEARPDVACGYCERTYLDLAAS